MEFQAFETWEEAMAEMEKNREAADKRVKPFQAAIKPDDYFARSSPEGFIIFGQVLETDHEFFQSARGRHFRFCKCYSIACPDGEMGDVHISEIDLVIDKETFDRFKEKDWFVEEGDEF